MESRPTAAQLQVLAETLKETVRNELTAEKPSPGFAARVFRGQREALGDDAATPHRAMLHEQADLGNDLALQVLALLADDPWWGQRDESLADRSGEE